MPKLRNDQVGRAGEYFVAAEIVRRGGYAVTFSGNMPGIDIIASDPDQTRMVTVQVKTKTRGDWQTSTRRARPHAEDPLDGRFWVLVDLGTEHPGYFVMPAWWIENDIHEAHQAYVEKRGGHRAQNDLSTHHSIKLGRVEQWRGRWDVLGVFGAEPTSS